jgi:hypothetical protein
VDRMRRSDSHGATTTTTTRTWTMQSRTGARRRTPGGVQSGPDHHQLPGVKAHLPQIEQHISARPSAATPARWRATEAPGGCRRRVGSGGQVRPTTIRRGSWRGRPRTARSRVGDARSALARVRCSADHPDRHYRAQGDAIAAPGAVPVVDRRLRDTAARRLQDLRMFL